MLVYVGAEVVYTDLKRMGIHTPMNTKLDSSQVMGELSPLLEPNFSEKWNAEKIKILYKNLLLSIPADFLCSTIIFFALYQSSKQPIILSWYITKIIVSVLRLVCFYLYYYHVRQKPFALPIFVLGTVISAALWGFCASYLMPQDNLLAQMIIIVLIAGITSGGLQTLYADLLSNTLFNFAILGPICIWFFAQNKFAYFIIGLSMCIYLVFMLIAGFRNNRILANSFLLQYKNLQLIHDLSISHQKLQNTNQIVEGKLLELTEHEIEMTFINKVNEMLQTCQRLEEARLIIAQSAKDLFHGLSGGLVVYDPSIGSMEVIEQWGKSYLKKYFSLDDCWALREGHFYLNNSHKHFLCNHFDSPPSGDYICLPQNINAGMQGMLILVASQESTISPHIQQLATSFNDVIKLSLANIQLRESLKEKSSHDSLTKLANRHFLNETFPREILRAIREKYCLSVCMLDIDFFKKFNDENGHEAGDEVLKFIGKTLIENIRKFDIACRFGGEEFLLVLVNVDTDAALVILQKIREKIKEGRVSFQGHLLPQITLSIGIAEAPKHGSSSNEIIGAADIALYQAKKNGRDRIEFFGK